MRRRDVIYFWVLGALFLGWSLSYSQQKQKGVTVFYTHSIDGCLEPCG